MGQKRRVTANLQVVTCPTEDDMKNIYHLGLSRDMIKEAKFAILPGDPERVPKIARAFDANAAKLAWKREFRTWLGELEGMMVLVTSTGIGGPSTSIVVEELARLGVHTFIRVGTTGAIQKEIRLGDVIITTGSVRFDGASRDYAPIEYPAVTNYEVLEALVQGAKTIAVNYHLGITASSDTFYPGQERYDSFSGYVIKKLKGSLKEWQKLKVLNYEMESSTLFVMCSTLGLRSGCVSGVVVNRTEREEVKEGVVTLAEKNITWVAIEAMRYLIQK